ncbi:MAG: flagellar biosynthetic protein FliR [Planctomycetota bacterium]|nr:flagellar biosynthetic protein FliR [Planctomycetota bacterium]
MMLLADGTVEAFGLFLTRTSALVLAAPLLGSSTSFSGAKIGVVGILSVVLFLSGGEPLGYAPGIFEFALLAAREVAIGLFLAFILQLVMLAVRVAGVMVGHEMSFNMANLVDPNTGTQTPIIAFFYETLFILALLAADAHLWLIRALDASYERAPVGVMNWNSAAPEAILEMFSQLFKAGLTFAAPVMVLLSIVSVLMGLLIRAVPQINVIEFGFNLRVLGGLVALLLFAPWIRPASDHLLDALMFHLNSGLNALEATNG